MNLMLPMPEFSIGYLRRLNARLKEILTEMNNASNRFDYMLEIPAGRTEFSSVNKFGRSTNVDSGVATDIHDGANATDDVAVWVAPTQARVHAIVSTSTDDDGAPVGTGARTIQVYGLTSWSTSETSETITLNGTTGVNTTKSYVIIHRMKVITKGAADPNVGVITATAATDGTVTAQINAGEGQTQMAIYGIPSTKTAYLTAYYASIQRANTASVNITLLANTSPDTELISYLVKHTQAVNSAGTGYFDHHFHPYNKFSGPCILKIQAAASANNADVSAGFDLIMEDA